MKNEFFKDTRILDAIDHIDSDLIAETAAKIRPPVSPKREAEQSKKTKFFTAWKQAAALVACALLMGALITDGSETLYAPRLNVEVKSTVGAGDAMIAGLTAGCLAELPLSEIFIKGVACATASVMTEGTQLIDKATYKSLLDKVDVKSI